MMSKPTVVTILGTRPEIIKLCVFIEEMDSRIDSHLLVHTDQHYDYDMDEIFMNELGVRTPNHRLHTKSRNPVEQLGDMITQLGMLFRAVEPAAVVVLGDTNSTLAGALAAKKSGVRLAHIESGCRSFDPTMPEEQNRVVTDHLSDILFAPSSACVRNLAREGIGGSRVHLVGSTLIDVCARNLSIARMQAEADLPAKYALMTIHRAANLSSRERLSSILKAMAEVSRRIPVVFPVHPHTRKTMEEMGIMSDLGDIQMLPPMGYLQFLRALSGAEFVLTDSGGVQQEAQVLGIPILTARRETEWVETVECGGCRLVDADTDAILGESFKILDDPRYRESFRSCKNPYSERDVSRRIAEVLVSCM
jgi:UDP-N-acetylglucosamine 2-epimerase